MEKRISYQTLFIIIVVIFIGYGSAFIYRTSFQINNQRYFCLADDEMISMKYAKNFACGYGLVWNKDDERVEGYTNLLWVLYMSVFHLFPIPASKISLFIQMSGLLFLVLNLFAVRKIAKLVSNNSKFVYISSVFFTAFYFPLNYWSLHGFEISALVLLINLSAILIVKAQKSNKFNFIPYLLLALATLLRPDMIVSYIVVIIYLLTSNKTWGNKNTLYSLIPLILFLFGQTLFRLFYYGELLPNTYYLKMTGYPLLIRFSRGLLVFLDFIWKTNWVLLLMPFSLIFLNKYKYLKLLFMIVIGQILYSIYVGGDAWEWFGVCNRFIVIAMPLFFILFSLSVYEISSYIKKLLTIKSESLKFNVCLILFLIFSLFSFNFMNGLQHTADWMLFKPPFQVLAHKSSIESGLYIEKITIADAKVAVVWAGAMPYFVDRHYVDLLGRNDKKIAREEMRKYNRSKKLFAINNITNSKYTFFYPGHLKWSYHYSIGQRRPDVIAQLWGDVNEAIPYLRKHYIGIVYKGSQIFLRRNSKHIHWKKIEKQNN